MDNTVNVEQNKLRHLEAINYDGCSRTKATLYLRTCIGTLTKGYDSIILKDGDYYRHSYERKHGRSPEAWDKLSDEEAIEYLALEELLADFTSGKIVTSQPKWVYEETK